MFVRHTGGQITFRRFGGVSQLRVVCLQPAPQPFKMFPCLRLVCIGQAEVFDGFAGCNGHAQIIRRHVCERFISVPAP